MHRLAFVISILMAIMVFSAPAVALDIVPSVSGNNQFIKGWVGLGDPNAGLVGLYAGWNDEDPSRLWSAGVRGQIDVSDPMRAVIGPIFNIPQQWWDALDKVGARVYVAQEIGVSNLTRDPGAEATPIIGARLFVFTAELGYKIRDAGLAEGPEGILDKSGLTWFVGVGRTFRF